MAGLSGGDPGVRMDKIRGGSIKADFKLLSSRNGRTEE